MEKIVMVTGASGGLGQPAGRIMFENGWQVAQVTRDAGRVDSIQEGSGEIIEVDVSMPGGSKNAIDFIQQHLGAMPSALLNCAGSVLIGPIIVKGIERRRIFYDDNDRGDFLKRLGDIVVDTKTACFAWALMPNHLHLLLRTGIVPIATVMRRLLTGYAVTFNRCH